MPIPRERLRLQPSDRAELLATERIVHCATVGPDGRPHVAPLWFVWDGDALWVNSLRKSRRGRDLANGSPVSCCVDAGVEYGELRGITLDGVFEEREPSASVKRAYAEKYWHGADVPDLASHRWCRLRVEREASWDFRRIGEVGRDRRLEALDGKDA